MLDKSVAARVGEDAINRQLERIMEPVGLCPFGQLEQLYSATSGRQYDAMLAAMQRSHVTIEPPKDIFNAVLGLQRDLAHHHGLWHRVPMPDLFIAVTALANNYGVLHNDKDYERIAKVRPLVLRRVG